MNLPAYPQCHSACTNKVDSQATDGRAAFLVPMRLRSAFVNPH